ncbi:MAG: DUF4339 domain-containing protein [Planctomycetaceae bacterium]|jgi:hypothetical protein|nr:DUF4339 domain-containing protein [Planctomycetaceae bacterium]
MWHYSKDGSQFGPVSGEEISNLVRNRTLGVDNLVWKSGMSAWIRIGDSEFAAAFVPPQHTSPDTAFYPPSQPETIVNAVNRFVILYIILSVLCVLSDIIDVGVFYNPPGEEEVNWVSFFVAVLMLGIGIFSLFLQYVFLVGCWRQIPPHIARMTPEIAGCYAVIPFFSFYGWFPAFVGLVMDMNKAAQQYLFNPSFAVFTCIFWIFYEIISLALVMSVNDDGGMPPVIFGISLILNVADCAVTCSFLIALKEAMLRFMAIKRQAMDRE